MRNMLLLFSLFLLTSFLSAQTKYTDSYSLGLTTGYTYAKSHFIQIGGIFGKDYGNVHIPSKGFGLGTDIGNVNNTLTVGAKAFYEYNFFIVTSSRINVISYFNGQNFDFRLLPQFGFSLFGTINLLYGYSILIKGKEIVGISRHSFSLTINLFREGKREK